MYFPLMFFVKFSPSLILAACQSSRPQLQLDLDCQEVGCKLCPQVGGKLCPKVTFQAKCKATMQNVAIPNHC